MAINEILKIADKATLFKSDYMPTLSNFGNENKAVIQAIPEMESKLRSMVDMLPNIKTGLSIMANNPDMMECERQGARNILEKIEAWENE